MSNRLTLIHQKRIDKIAEYLVSFPKALSSEVARALKIPAPTCRRIVQDLRLGVVHTSTEKNTLTSELLREPPNLEEFVVQCQVDLATHRVAHHIINCYEQGSKNEDTGAVTVTKLYQIKVWIEPIAGADEAAIIKETMEWIRVNTPVNPAIIRPKAAKLLVEDPVMLEIAIPDLHLGKLTWAPETGENYNISVASSTHQHAVEALWNRASIFPIQKVLLVTGHDFFNSNGADNETASGTPMTEDGRWQKSFRIGIATIHRAVEFLRTRVVEVEVLFVAGNHDREKAFYLGAVIEAMYANVPGVVISNSPKIRQYRQWGTVLLGVTHGDGAKADKLPLIMASEAADLWGATTYREIHTGHFHHKRETVFHAGNEHNAVRVRVLPSLTTTDVWHSLNGFVCQRRAAECFLWGQKQGYIGQFSWSPNP